MKCQICDESVGGGKYQAYEICHNCSTALDDIIAAYFEKLEKDVEMSASTDIPYYVLLLSRKLRFLEQTMWWKAYDEMLQNGESDDEYYYRLERVIKWFDENPDVVKKIGEQFFAKCEKCGKKLLPGSVTIQDKNGSFVVMCRDCGNEIVACSICRKLNE
jgi:hypothetical protein